MKNHLKLTYVLSISAVLICLGCTRKYSLGQQETDKHFDFSEQITSIENVQNRAPYFARIGRSDKAIEAFPPGCPPPKDDEILGFFRENYNPHNAVEVILKKADSVAVIILNHHNHLTQNHVFASSILEGLYDKGYRSLGVEGISAEVSLNSCSQIQDCFETLDPQFINLIRRALEVGYRVFPIDHPNMRKENSGLDTSVTAICEHLNDAKVLIYSSPINASEYNLGPFKGTIASLVRSRLDTDPLTIDQVAFMERSSEDYEEHLYTKVPVSEATIFRYDSSESYQIPGTLEGNDLYIFHPRSDKEYERPKWLSIGGSKIHEFELSDVAMSYPLIISAYKMNQSYFPNIAVDVFEVENPRKSVGLVLPNGRYQIVIRNEKGESKTMRLRI